MRKRLTPKVLIGLVLVVLMTGLSVRILRGSDTVTQENTARIREGMSVQHVEAILGGPAHDAVTQTGPESKAVLIWGGEEGVAFVWFSAEGLVVKTEFRGGSEGQMIRGDLALPVTKEVLKSLFSQTP
jgi:hypothetical protein